MMTIEEAARIIEAEAGVLDFKGKLAVAQCIVDNDFNAGAFMAPVSYYSPESLGAAKAAMLRGERRFPGVRLL